MLLLPGMFQPGLQSRKLVPLARLIFMICFLTSGPGIGTTSAQTRASGSCEGGGEESARQGKAGALPDPGKVKSFVPMTAKNKFHHYLRSLVHPLTILGTTAAAGIGQARDNVPEWGQQMPGYGRRLASSYGKRAVKESIDHGLGALLRYDPRYFPSQKKGTWARVFAAVAQSFRTRDDHYRWRIDIPHLGSAFGAGLISRAWYPERYQTIGNGLKSGAITLGLDTAANLLREFRRRGR
jgi:hypothetical protein